MRSIIKSAVWLLTVFALSYSFADTFVVTAEKPGVQTPPLNLTYENFSSQSAGTTLGNGTFTTHFGSNQYLGTYSGTIDWYSADTYGGAGGTGVYPEVFMGQSYTLNITPQGNAPAANYFGLWFSALDKANLLQFYKGNTLVYSFTPAYFVQLVGGCPNGADPYCGNPNANFLGRDGNEQFAYLNFWDSNGSFNRIVVSETTQYGGGFESDNHTVAFLPEGPGGQPVTPEPGTLLMLGSGMLAGAGVLRRKIMPR